MMRALVSVAVLVLALVDTRPSRAHPTDCSAIPNGSLNTCSNCHVSASGGGLRTPFGEDVATTRSGGAVQWPALYALDSDSDTQTNGQELGDPCGDWSTGQTPGRTSAISNPGVTSSVSATPTVPACTIADAGGRDRATAIDSSAPRPDSAVPPRDSGARDVGGGHDVATADRATAMDVAGAEQAVCVPICIDSRRYYRCSANGTHLETPCPSGQFCSDGACRTSAVDGGQDGDAAACGCRSGPIGSAPVAILLLALIRWRRFNRWPRPSSRARPRH